MVAFKTTNIKEASERDHFWYLGHRIEFNPSMGIILSTCTTHTRATWHWNVLRNMARWHRWHAILSLCQSTRMLCDAYDTHLYMLYIDMDKGLWTTFGINKISNFIMLVGFWVWELERRAEYFLNRILYTKWQ